MAFQWCCLAFNGSLEVTIYCYLSSSNLLFIIDLIRDLFVFCVDSLMGKEIFMPTKDMNHCTSRERS